MLAVLLFIVQDKSSYYFFSVMKTLLEILWHVVMILSFPTDLYVLANSVDPDPSKPFLFSQRQGEKR